MCLSEDNYLDKNLYDLLYGNTDISCELILNNNFFNKSEIKKSETDLLCYELLEDSDIEDIN